ncbi:uncharacterized protein PG998_006627 [Apiospora kogelbergensis]|uniref:uncharacterized protein n=1 Tax=Apiospora kogelbergensis TaxID=1337665 RepID=UPI00312D636C
MLFDNRRRNRRAGVRTTARDVPTHKLRDDGILIADSGVVAQENREILGRLTAFAKSGGTVVYSFCFATSIRPGVMGQHWDHTWKLPWKAGQYHRTTFEFNETAICTVMTLGKNSSSSSVFDAEIQECMLLPQYSQKAVHLSQVYPENRWYMPTSHSRLESLIPAPDLISRITNLSETPVAFARVGDGYVGYTGDVNQETGTNLVLLRMFNLDGRQAVWA